MEDKEDWKSDWITLEEEGVSNDFMYNHEFVERIEELHAIYDLRENMYPECKDSDRPAIMGDVKAFRYGFKFPESAHRNLTKSTLSKILKNFLDYGSLPDSLFMLGNIRFLTRLFDLEEVREQVRAYLTSPYNMKGEYLVFLLEYQLKKESRLTLEEKQVVSELLGFLNE